MAIAAGALTVASSLLSIGAGVYSYSVASANVKREKKLGELRADQRREELRRVLSAQRVALASQGRNPDTGTSLVLADAARQNAAFDSRLDRFQTGAAVQNYRAQGTTAILAGLSSASSSLSSYGRAKAETKLGTPTGGQG